QGRLVRAAAVDDETAAPDLAAGRAEPDELLRVRIDRRFRRRHLRHAGAGLAGRDLHRRGLLVRRLGPAERPRPPHGGEARDADAGPGRVDPAPGGTTG